MNYARDLLERVLMTFVQAFLGAITVTSVADIDKELIVSAAVAGGSAVLALVKGLVAKWTGPTDGAGLGT